MKKLYRSRENRVIAGVCGGLGEYFNIDPVIIRIILLLMFFLQGMGIMLYIIAWIIIPAHNEEEEHQTSETHTGNTNHEFQSRSALIVGIFLVLIGVFFLIKNFWFYEYLRVWGEYSLKYIFPLLLVITGIYLLVRSKTK